METPEVKYINPRKMIVSKRKQPLRWLLIKGIGFFISI
jgi:hypothetical protein